MDAVYILGSASLADNKEILYSVRSLAMHMLDLRNIYVVGGNVPFLPNVIHIPATDPTKDKWRNAFYKVKQACKIDALSSDFLLMNDDFFMLEAFNGADFPYYALKNGNGGPCGPIDFSIHCPIRLNKAYYPQIPLTGEEKGTLSPRTFYANFYKAPPVMTQDFLVRTGKHFPSLDAQTEKMPCFSISNGAMLEKEMLDFLDGLYPDPSRFE